ncbi:MAG: recombination mediator RecR [Cytophagales bacterium]|nr:recombination mediator RecR [Cytophagales bacterium]
MSSSSSSSSSQLLSEAVQAMTQFPGVGEKTALRMVLYLLKQEPKMTEHLTHHLLRLVQNIRYCERCHSLADQELCSVCTDPERDQSLICVVEQVHDVLIIEKTDQYKGLYHVLGGVISPIRGVAPSDLPFSSLWERISEGKVKELVIALNANMEGDTTAHYLAKKCTSKGIRVSALARGIPMGGELEYTDELTLGRSIQDRVIYSLTAV